MSRSFLKRVLMPSMKLAEHVALLSTNQRGYQIMQDSLAWLEVSNRCLMASNERDSCGKTLGTKDNTHIGISNGM